jgi:hypothetical protein
MSKSQTIRQWLTNKLETGGTLNDSYSRRILRTAERYGLDITVSQARGHADVSKLKALPKEDIIPFTARFTDKENQNYKLGLKVISEMRRVKSLGEDRTFEQTYGIFSKLKSFPKDADKATVKKLVASALTPAGTARDTDRLERKMVFYNKEGQYEVTVRGIKKARLISDYHQAMKLYRDKGDYSELEKFKGKYVLNSQGKKRYFITDKKLLDRFIEFGETDFYDIYAS